MSLHNVPYHNPDENIINLACRLKSTQYLVVLSPPLRSGILVRVVAWQGSTGMRRVQSLVVGLIMAHCLRRLQCVETKHRLLFFSASGKNLKKCRLGKPGGRLLTYCLSHGGRLPTDSAVFNQHKRISNVTPPCASSCKNEHFSRTCGTSSQAELIFSLTRGRTLCLFEVGLLPNCVWECVQSKCSIRGGQLPLFAPAGSSSQTATRSSHVDSHI